jgi:hypothetical protein
MILKPDLLLQEQPARRGFLRNLIAAPVAALATHKLILPAQALGAPEDAAARLQYHLDGVESAMRDLFPDARVRRWGTALTPEGRAVCREDFAAGRRGGWAVVAVDAGLDLGRRS